MKKNITFLFFLVSLSLAVSAQVGVEKTIKGQITADAIPLSGINIINTSSKIKTLSDQYGNFSITAKEGDVLSFSAVDYEPLRKIINKQEFNLGSIVVNMTATSIELREVVVNKHSEITAENLGIIPQNQIKLTPAERKVYTATSTPTDALLNYFSGRTKMLKKEVAVEQKESLMAKLEYLFEDKYYIETLKIPEEHIKGFQYYCVEDADFANALKSKNKTMSMFLIVGLAFKYNKNRENTTEGN
ncbi:carboxypeptidase-like regulatory domain-containing protein [Flavobacterium aestivum]|uniref:carboxypeptidase-like regulatory domain-containing protein n=1 Tax=Flavobacterium aestivum TaxID=3003257 RepID=UPI0024829121|nr:carboxypeptidase-like regulatory domain-containing protein [Flavobacterium aestivum]